ncbi:hypothetical protein BG004_006771 [Podila humilis]|nr:hypothetical protein BG004_006771 [Podila humilis]
MGITQAGKSTLIQHIKNYADPKYSINDTLIGDGNSSKTSRTDHFSVCSDLPRYEVYNKTTGKAFAVDELPTQITDVEDYREILFTRESRVKLQKVPQADASFVNFEFDFLDTPGLNDTRDTDAANATDIINEVIRTKTFNLIVIVLSRKAPLTREQQLALEYYADVLHGLHSLIMFLHTHVDFAHIHHSNTIHRDIMLLKDQELRKIFSYPKRKPCKHEPVDHLYPSLTIDLIAKKRPVINCMIRNTIQKILELATRAPIALDTSISNINRIQAIPHPDTLNDAEKKKIKKRFEEERLNQEQELNEPAAPVGGENLKDINILLIGDVQSGKSSLVEMFGLYSNPHYVPRTQHIFKGSNRNSDAKVKVTSFVTDLHIAQVRRKAGSNDVIDLDLEATRGTEEDFEDILNLNPRDAETEIIHLDEATQYKFNIYEGPSLNESSETFERHIFEIHKEASDPKLVFHQVLFTLSPGPITKAIKNTIHICSDIFSDLKHLFSFVHTKTDYPKLFHGNRQFHDSMNERQRILKAYLWTDADPYLIDCNLQSDLLPVQRVKTFNTIHNIFKTANDRTPANLQSTFMKKTPKMVAIDTNLKWQARDAFQETQKEITKNNKELVNHRKKIRDAVKAYKAEDQIFNEAKNKECVTSRNDMEKTFDEWPHFNSGFDASNAPKILTYQNRSRTIEKIVFENESNIEIESQLGGEGYSHWRMVCRRKTTTTEAASIRVMIYVRKLDGKGDPMSESPKMAELRRQRMELESQLPEIEDRVRSNWENQDKYNLVRDWISRATLPRAVMQKLVDANVYELRETPFDEIQKIYESSPGVYDTDLTQEPRADGETNEEKEKDNEEKEDEVEDDEQIAKSMAWTTVCSEIEQESGEDLEELCKVTKQSLHC